MSLVRASQGTACDHKTFQGYRNDVFLSFRGKDTGKKFTDHLYTALNNAGFLTFRDDDDELERGEDIKPELQKVIQLSRTSAIVFSKDYVSSRRCLNELVVILERKRTSTDHVVLPIFYNIDPSRIRKQTGSIQKTFARHQKIQSPEKVRGWSEALAEVANLAGMVLQNQADGYESKFIQKIVKVIGDMLSRTPLIVEPKLIGIHSQVEHINLWLQDGSTDVDIFVVYDIFGFGKTTIAKHVYNSNLRCFQGTIFIANIREAADGPNGLVPIQMQLLSTILTGKEMMHNVSEGLIEIEGAISSAKVVLVLGDVDRIDQLDGVLKMKDQFYPGSKILIATGCKRLLKAHQVTRWGYHYDVFLSFRGEDTRKTFTDHLYTALKSAGYRTFRDDDELETGEDIKSGLEQAIQMSRTSIIVFSKNYASSKWCLEELLVIVDHKRTSSDHEVIPVFYNVDPSHVRKQTGSFAKAFARHRKTELHDRTKRWREALAEVADLAGTALRNRAYGYESKLIKDIVKVIGDKLSRKPLSIESKLIGIHSQVEYINLWLQDPSHDVGILVLYGMPGIGKTTIVKYAYNSNFESFEGSSYVENIREIIRQPDGLVQIQKKIVYDILKGKKEKIEYLSVMLERAISSRRVLLVLDAVDNMDQLHAVLRIKDRFYPGSKILITTRHERLLNAHGGITLHEVGPLGFNESLELLSWHAFRQDHPLEGYEEYSEEVVRHSRGLPLALKVLGSSLFGEPKHVWESTLEKLEVIPNGEIMNKLRICYDSLQDDHDQKLFLHIACFFIGKGEDYIVKILDGCDFKTICGIQNLRNRSLVTIDMDKLYMHDMIRDMGREIIRRESDKPGNHSRLCCSEDSFKVLREKNGTEAIEGLILDMPKLLANIPITSNETVLGTNAFARMHKLKILHLRHVRLDGCYAEFPAGLTWLCWPEFPLCTIPIDFSLEKVVCLEMQHSSLKQVLGGANFLPSLKILNISHSHGLTEIMDFSLCPNLEELILIDCTSLIVVDESIGNLERLVYLNMKDCKNLKMLPKNMCMLKSLETLILSGCSNLDDFPVEMMKKIDSLKVLEIDGIPISELWPERSSTILSSLPCSLVVLSFRRCNLSDNAFCMDLSSLSSLQRVDLGENPICSLPGFIKGLRRLDQLSFYGCDRLESLVGLPKVHEMIIIAGCISLKKITYQSLGSQGSILVRDNYNIVEWEYFYKLEPIDRVDVEMITLLGLCNLGSLPPIRMNTSLQWSSSKKGRWSPVQGLYQFGIFSTFFAGNEVPGQFNYKSTKSSVSFIVPLLLDSHKIRGLNIFATYAKAENSDDDYCDSFHPILTKVSNKSKGLKWIYGPTFYGIPGDGEDMIWLSHWKMENKAILQCGDEVVVSVFMKPGEFQLKEFGVELVQEHQNDMMISTEHNTKSDPHHPFVIGGDLSLVEKIPGIYFLWILPIEVSDKINFCRPRWLNHLIMDSDEEDTDKEGQEDEPDYIIAKTRPVSNNCSHGCWKVLLTAAGFFFTLALVVRSSISQKKKRQ